jgi:hypothetical protein
LAPNANPNPGLPCLPDACGWGHGTVALPCDTIKRKVRRR